MEASIREHYLGQHTHLSTPCPSTLSTHSTPTRPSSLVFWERAPKLLLTFATLPGTRANPIGHDCLQKQSCQQTLSCPSALRYQWSHGLYPFPCWFWEQSIRECGTGQTNGRKEDNPHSVPVKDHCGISPLSKDDVSSPELLSGLQTSAFALRSEDLHVLHSPYCHLRSFGQLGRYLTLSQVPCPRCYFSTFNIPTARL